LSGSEINALRAAGDARAGSAGGPSRPPH
jgi:hypothetical protein